MSPISNNKIYWRKWLFAFLGWVLSFSAMSLFFLKGGYLLSVWMFSISFFSSLLFSEFILKKEIDEPQKYYFITFFLLVIFLFQAFFVFLISATDYFFIETSRKFNASTSMAGIGTAFSLMICYFSLRADRKS